MYLNIDLSQKEAELLVKALGRMIVDTVDDNPDDDVLIALADKVT